MTLHRLLFVCTGNSCRSVMAEHLLKYLLNKAGRCDIIVASAGVFALDGMGATAETKRVLQNLGIDAGNHHTRRLLPIMVEDADLVLAMEPVHREEILRFSPDAANKVHLFTQYGIPEGEWKKNPVSIRDPIGNPLEVYEVCFAQIQEGVKRIVQTLGISANE